MNLEVGPGPLDAQGTAAESRSSESVSPSAAVSPLFDPAGWTVIKHNGKSVGWVANDGSVYRTSRQRRIHYVRKYQGYGIQKKLLLGLVKAGVKRIVLEEVRHDPNTGRMRSVLYTVEPDYWLHRGTTDILRLQDGLQVFLSERQLVSAQLGASK